MAPQANRENRQRHAGSAGQYHGEDERHPKRHAKLHDEQRGGIGADAVERRLTEVELTGIAENEVKADREHDIDRADDQVRAPIGILKYQRQDRDDDRGGKEPPAPVTGLAGKRPVASRFSAISPVGRNASTSRSSVKTTRSVRPGFTSWVVKLSIKPTTSPAMIVPSTLPNPPMMTMAKA